MNDLLEVKNLSVVWLALMLTAAACATDETADPETPEQPEALFVETLGVGNSGSMRDTTEAVYRSLEEWQDVATRLKPLESFQEPDTTQEMVLLVAIPTNSGGYSVQFTSVELTGEELVATYEFSVPGHDCLTVSALSLPFRVVAVRKSELPVRFVREERYYSCST